MCSCIYVFNIFAVSLVMIKLAWKKKVWFRKCRLSVSLIKVWLASVPPHNKHSAWQPGPQDNMLLVNLQTTDAFTYVNIIGYISYWHFSKTCQITLTLHVYDLTFMSCVRAGKPVTPVQERVSTFVSLTALLWCQTWICVTGSQDICFHVCVNKPQVFLTRPWNSSSCVCSIQNRYFSSKLDLFLILPKWKTSCLELTKDHVLAGNTCAQT